MKNLIYYLPKEIDFLNNKKVDNAYNWAKKNASPSRSLTIKGMR